MIKEVYMTKKNVHIVKRDDGWAVEKVGNQKASFICDTKKEAILKGSACAKSERAELVVHNMDGKISWRNSYGNDPFPPRG